MSAATAVAPSTTTPTPTIPTTYVVEITYDLSMDFTSHWAPIPGHEPYFTPEAAEAARLAYCEEHEWFDGEALTRVRTVPGARPETGYSDPFLEAEFAANAQYWAGRAAEASRVAEAKAEMERCFGKGAVVRVVKGRKVPVGTEGTVFWLGEDRYSRTGGMRVGFKDATGTTHWTSLDNVESLVPAFEKEA